MQRPLKSNTKMLIFAALFTAVICVFSQIAVPTPILPITLQIFGVCLCGYLLGARFSLLSVLCYIALGAIGLPVFYGFQGGAHHLFNLTGGFIFGFLPLAFCTGISHKLKKDVFKILFGIIGVLICHVIGVIQFSLISANGIMASFCVASLPFLTKDIPLCIAAFYLTKLINKRIKRTA